jgi:ornithine cyclodeaminase
MRQITQDELDALLDFPNLIEAIAAAFVADHVAPHRHHHEIKGATEPTTHLLMPAWTADAPGANAFIGTKIATVFGANAAAGLPSVMAVYVLQSGKTGAPLATMDGTRLTLWRTAAASALAARFLARADSAHLLMVGAGALAPFLIRAHASVRPIRRVTIWNRRRDNAKRLATALSGEPWAISVADHLDQAIATADIISCATLAHDPLVHGAWLQPGTHLDLAGAYNLSMRECDDAAITRARLFIDTVAAKTEGGDVAVALKAGLIAEAAIEADLFELCRGVKPGRITAEEITLFKSVGTAIEDLAAAMLVWKRAQLPSTAQRL